MIRFDETLLTSDEYDALALSRESSVWSVIAHRWNPVFTSEPVGSSGDNDNNFAAGTFLDVLYRISGQVLEIFDGATWTTSSGFAPPLRLKKPPSVFTDDALMTVFVSTSTGIKKASSSNYDTWSSWSTVVTDANVAWIAATAADRIHYLTKDTSLNRYQLHVATYAAGSWTVSNSDIYWPFQIGGLAAARQNGVDILVIATQVPGVVSATYVNNEVVKYALESGGLIGFTYENSTWSDHFEIDILDEIHPWRYRATPRLSLYNNMLYLTCTASDGTENFPIVSYRTYRSGDGYHWTMGDALQPEGLGHEGLELVHLGEKLYAVESEHLSSSDSTAQFGYSSAAVRFNLTGYIEQYTLSQGGGATQAMIALANQDNWMAETFLNNENVVELAHYAGFFFEDDTTPTLIQIAVTEIDAIRSSESLGLLQKQITSRDKLSWMIDRSQSPIFRYWESQMFGGDDYTDSSDTGYGALQHTATQSGNYSTRDGFLNVMSNNEDAIAFSTFKSTLWNGAINEGIRLSTADNSEYAGILFRGQDKDNYWGYRYEQANDHLRLFRQDGAGTIYHWTSGAMGWSGNAHTTWHYLMVRYRYCRIELYHSLDNITWILDQVVLVEGQDSGDPLIQNGFVGELGKGFSPEDVWPEDPGVLPPPVYLDPGNNYYYVPGDLPNDGVETYPEVVPVIPAITTHQAMHILANGDYVWTDNYNALAGPNWHRVARATWASSLSAGLFPALQLLHDPQDGSSAIMMINRQVYRIGNLYNGTPSLTLLTNLLATDALKLCAHGNTIFVAGQESHLIASNMTYLAWSGNRGASWTQKRTSTFQVLTSLGLPGGAIGPDGTCYFGQPLNLGGVKLRICKVIAGNLNSVIDTTIDSHQNLPNIFSNDSGTLIGYTDFPTSITPMPARFFPPSGNAARSILVVSGGLNIQHDYLDAATWWAIDKTHSHLWRTSDAGSLWSDLKTLTGNYDNMVHGDLDGDTVHLIRHSGTFLHPEFFDGINVIDRSGDIADYSSNWAASLYGSA